MREMDFGDYNDRLSKSGRDVLALAIEESRRMKQNFLAAEHLFLASAKVERTIFNETLQDLGLNTDEMLSDVREHLHVMKQYAGRGLKITFSLKSIFRLAWINSSERGGSKIEARDLLMGIFQEGNNIPIEVFRLHKVEPEKVVRGLAEHFGVEVPSGAELNQKFDLPHQDPYKASPVVRVRAPLRILAGLILLLLLAFLLLLVFVS